MSRLNRRVAQPCGSRDRPRAFRLARTPGGDCAATAWRWSRSATLITIALLAFFTPLLPLQPPDKHHTDLQYEPPQLSPLFDKDVRLRLEGDRRNAGKLAAVHEELAAAERTRSQTRLRRRRQGRERRRERVRRMENELNSVLHRPYREAGFPDLGAVSRWMVRRAIRSCSASGRSARSPAAMSSAAMCLSRVFWGARISIIVGIVATLVSLVIGVTYGAIAGYVGGWVDDVMMRFVDILYSIPFIFIVIFIITILSEDRRQGAARRLGHRPDHDFLFCRRRDLLADDGPRRSRPGDLAARRSRLSKRPGRSAPAKRGSSCGTSCRTCSAS